MVLSRGPNDSVLVADTSAVINLIASGAFKDVAATLEVPLRVVDSVAREIAAGRSRGWKTPDQFEELLKAGLIEVAELDEPALACFESLVIGRAAETLDDGEAATIAYAQRCGAVAVVDERKARFLCGQRFPSLLLQSTVEVLTSEAVTTVLGAEGVGDALFQALTVGRMRVRPEDIARVVHAIGAERARLCTSLPERTRTAVRTR